MSSAGSSAGAADGSGAEVQVQHVAAGEAIACQLQQAGAAAEIQEGTQFLIAGEDGQAYPVQGMITIPVGSGMYQVWTLARNSFLFSFYLPRSGKVMQKCRSKKKRLMDFETLTPLFLVLFGNILSSFEPE